MNFSTRRITQSLQLLEKQEIRKFCDFLNSPFFIKGKDAEPLSNLFQILDHYIIKKEAYEIPNKKLAMAISGVKELHLGKLEKSLSKLNSLIFDFLGIIGFQESNLLFLKTAEVLRKRDADNLWRSHIKKSEQLFSSKKENNFETSLELLFLKYEKFAFQQFPKKTSKEDVTNIISGFNDFYIRNMLLTGIQVLSDSRTFFSSELMNEFNALDLLLSSKSIQSSHPEIEILAKVYTLLSKKESNELDQLKDIKTKLDHHEKSISYETQINIRTIVKNYAIKLYNLGDLSIGNFIFDIYKQGIASGWLFHNSKIQIGSIFNIVHCAINEKDFSWAENFIEEVRNKILEESQKDFAIALVKARISFARKSYTKVLDTLNFNITDPSLKGLARILEIKAMYELESQQLEYKMEAFKVYMHRLKNAKVTPWFQQGHNNFIKILISINLPKTEFDLKRIEKIRAKIKATDILAEKRWLLEKIEEKAIKLK